MNNCSLASHVRRHFDGTISPEAEHAMRQHLPGCSSCRQAYRRHLLLARLDPSAMPARERLGRAIGLGSNHQAARGWVALAAAAAVALIILPRMPLGQGAARPGAPSDLSVPSSGNEYALRGQPVEPASRVFVYEVPDHGRPVRVKTTLRPDEGLAFAYENGRGKHRLAIFGVDEHGHVFWFHPAWTADTDTPVAIPIETDDRRHELPEAIRHDFDGAHLEIRSVFLDDAISVREIENMLKHTPSGPLPVAGAIESSLSLEVR
ncbi:MAG: hypothetical protein FWD17_18605 [Polyangiaceae bacterium]|nr:hypothetical protein [Polyangiaceae bacterium]